MTEVIRPGWNSKRERIVGDERAEPLRDRLEAEGHRQPSTPHQPGGIVAPIDQAARSDQDHRDQGTAIEQHPILGIATEQFGHDDQDRGPDDDADQIAEPADHDDQHDGQGLPEAEADRVDEALECGEDHPGKAAQRGRQAERQELRHRRVDTNASRCVLILPDRCPAEAEDGLLEAPGERQSDDDQRQQQPEEVLRRIQAEAEQKWLVDAGYSLRPIGQPDLIVQQQADDLAEPESNHGEIVAAQSQHRNAEQHAGETSEATTDQRV